MYNKTFYPTLDDPKFTISENSKKTPTAFITIKKSRLKTFNKNVYLKDNSEFEIELFNPDTITYGAKIEIDGQFISDNYLVLKPGERIFLKRYLNENQSFIYKTYIVENNNDDVKEAIKDNGNIKIYFYKEYIYKEPIQKLSYLNYSSNTGNIKSKLTSSFFSTSVDNSDFNFDQNIKSSFDCLDTVETGKIFKGNSTDQKFEFINITFESSINHIIDWKLLPISQKPIEKKDLEEKSYCSNCGKKLKIQDLFCSKCGTKK